MGQAVDPRLPDFSGTSLRSSDALETKSTARGWCSSAPNDLFVGKPPREENSPSQTHRCRSSSRWSSGGTGRSHGARHRPGGGLHGSLWPTRRQCGSGLHLICRLLCHHDAIRIPRSCRGWMRLRADAFLVELDTCASFDHAFRRCLRPVRCLNALRSLRGLFRLALSDGVRNCLPDGHRPTRCGAIEHLGLVTLRRAPSCAYAVLEIHRSGRSSVMRFAGWSAIRGRTSVRYATGSMSLRRHDATRLRLIA